MEELSPEDPVRVGRYRLVGRLGQGGMGQVFLALSPAGSCVAVKVIHPHFAADARFRSRFEREVANARRVSGAFTAPVIDADPKAAAPWLVTSYLPGLSLSEAVKAQGPFPLPTVYALAAGLAEGLSAVHQAGVVHRDLKPSNVLLSADGPRIIDFGIARAAEESGLTRPGAVLGSPGYMSPEQAAGQPLDASSDLFSLGAVIVFCATGVGPFGKGSVADLVRRVGSEEPRLDGVTDPFLRDLVADCMRRDPRQRPATWQILESLRQRAAAPGGAGWLPPELAAAIEARDQPVEPPLDRRGLLLGTAAAVTALAAGSIAGVRIVGRLDAVAAKAALATAPPSGGGPTPNPGGSRPAAGPTAAPPARPKELWQRPLPRFSWMAVDSGRVFANTTRGLMAFDARTGAPRWRIPGRANMRPVAAGGLAFTGESQRIALPEKKVLPGIVFGTDLTTGRRVWAYSPEGEGFLADPVAAGGFVCVAVYDWRKRQSLVGLDLRTGAERWRTSALPSPGASPLVELAALGDQIAVAYGDLYLFSAQNGEQVWRYAMKDARICGADAGVVYATGDDSQLHAVRDGKAFWTVAVGKQSIGGVLAADIVVVTEREAVTAVDKANGKFRWELRGSPTPDDWLKLVVGGARHLYVARDSDLRALDSATGAVRWRHTGPRGGTDYNHLIEAAGTVFVSISPGLHPEKARLHAFAVP